MDLNRSTEKPLYGTVLRPPRTGALSTVCKQPWQLLNFADPSRMEIHDDYYDDNYGVAYQYIDKLYVGIGTKKTNGRIHLSPLELKGWGNDVTSHERLKSSYYMLQALWTKNN